MNQEKIMKTFTLTMASIGLISLAVSQVSFSDSDEDHEHRLWQRTTGVSPVKNPLYEEECGSCHFAYPASLLPQRSWQAIMSGLEDHFGDNAELDSQNRQTISQYLSENSAEKSADRRSHQLVRGLSAGKTPLRITELPRFTREHDEVPKRVFQNNPDLSSLSQCAACHRDAKQGYFSERSIKIPGYGSWDD
jgi:hypothetical protein